MWPTLWALWIAGDGRPDARLLLIFLAGVLVMRSAGCVINDYADRDFDPSVRRTRDRPLAARRVVPTEALLLFAALGLVAVWLAMQLDPLARLYAVAGGMLTVTYPWLKRFVHLPQFYLGVAFGWSIPMAFAALTGTVPRIAWLLLIAVVLWAAVYDTMYAMVDRDDDQRIGIKSTAILFGHADRFMVGLLQASALLTFALLGAQIEQGSFYHLGLGAAAGLYLYQQYLMRDRSRSGCFRAFRNNVWVGFALFAGVVAETMVRPLLPG
jgi:4-hydroxybenzoate polyprenyltransferase